MRGRSVGVGGNKPILCNSVIHEEVTTRTEHLPASGGRGGIPENPGGWERATVVVVRRGKLSISPLTISKRFRAGCAGCRSGRKSEWQLFGRNIQLGLYVYTTVD